MNNPKMKLENNSIYNSTKKKTMLRNKFNKKKVQDLHTENYKMLLKKVQEDLKKMQIYPLCMEPKIIPLRWQYSPN